MAKFREFEDWRRKSGFGQAQLAEILGKQQRQVSEWETGKAPLPFSVMPKLRKLGYEGPAKPLDAPLTREDVENIVAARVAELKGWLVVELRELRRELKDDRFKLQQWIEKNVEGK